MHRYHCLSTEGKLQYSPAFWHFLLEKCPWSTESPLLDDNKLLSLSLFFYLGGVKQLPAASGRLSWPSSAGNWSPWEDGELILRAHEGTHFPVFHWVTAALCLGLLLCTRRSSTPNTCRCRFCRFQPVLLLVLRYNVSSKNKRRWSCSGVRNHTSERELKAPHGDEWTPFLDYTSS